MTHETELRKKRSSASFEFTFLFTLLFTFLGFEPMAQCSFTCPTTNDVSNPDTLILDNFCNITLPAISTFANLDCSSNTLSLNLYNQADNSLIISESNLTYNQELVTELVEHAQVIYGVYTDDTGQICTIYFQAEDQQDASPQYELGSTTMCDFVEVACTSTLDLSNTDFLPIDIIDNCNQYNVSIDPTILMNSECSTGFFPNEYTQLYSRTWSVEDQNTGAISECIQMVRLIKYDVNDFTINSPLFLQCQSATGPESTGFPTYNALEIRTDGVGIVTDQCNVFSAYSDQIIGNDNEFVITRTWEIRLLCDNSIVATFDQIINVADTQSPLITCPPLLSLNTSSNPSDGCQSSVQLPSDGLVITDNCSTTELSASITLEDGSVLNYDLNNGAIVNQPLPVGTHQLSYSVTDNSNAQNSSSCNVTIIVIDDTAPNAILDPNPQVSLNSTCTATVEACIFDLNEDGCNNPASHDDCDAEVVFTASIDNVNFSEFLNFDQSHLGQTTLVYVRVCELNNLNSCTTTSIGVEVLDNNAPFFTSCPSNLTLPCTTDLSDLSNYGMPTVMDNCNVNVTETVENNLDACSTGTIVRTFRAIDASNNEVTCQQTITLINSTPYDGTGLSFFNDTTFVDLCIVASENNINPENLYPNINYIDYILPDNTQCTMLSVAYEDQIFNTGDNAFGCFTILRTWTVIDMCQYDFNNPGLDGIWTDEQTLTFEDNTVPQLNVPTLIELSADDTCQGVQAQNIIASATDNCQSSITISNSFTDDTDGSANGYYPLGDTQVVFTASDGCGNTSNTTITVRVTDLTKPTLACHSGLNTNLSLMGNGGMVMVSAESLVYESTDNCTPEDQIQYYIAIADDNQEDVPTSNTIALDCIHLGPTQVEVYAVDLVGNFEVCITTINVQDLNNNCPVNIQSFVAQGQIYNYSNDPLIQVPVQMCSSQDTTYSATDQSGQYSIQYYDSDDNHMLMPFNNENASQGVTVYDIILIIRHVQGYNTLDTPYKLIAADANNSKSITMSDVIAIKKVILGLASNFPNHSSWVYIAEGFQFETESDPLTQDYPTSITIDGNLSDEPFNFIGIKIGDVNNTHFHNGIVERNLSSPLVLNTSHIEFNTNQEIEIPISISPQTKNLVGAQFSLKTLAHKAKIIDIQLSDPIVEMIDYHIDPEGLFVNFLLHSSSATTLSSQYPLLTVKLKTHSVGQIENTLLMDNTKTNNIAYFEPIEQKVNSSQVVMVFQKNNLDLNDGLLNVSVHPNPTSDHTTIAFMLKESGKITLNLINSVGKVISQASYQMQKGQNSIELSSDLFTTSGTYHYHIISQHNSQSGTIIKN